MNTFPEAAVRRCSSKYVLLKISQYSELKEIPTEVHSCKKQPLGGLLKKWCFFFFLQANVNIDRFHFECWDSDFMP